MTRRPTSVEQANLRLVETGELAAEAPTYSALVRTVGELEAVRDELTRKLHGMAAELGKLKRDRDREDKESDVWPLGLMLFNEWRIATDRIKSRWTHRRFREAKPYLVDYGFVICRWAIWGIAYQPFTKELPGNRLEVYNDWATTFKNDDAFERYARGYTNPEARKQFSLREQGVADDDATINPNLYFASKER